MFANPVRSYGLLTSVVDLHRFVADPDPDLNFHHSDADPDTKNLDPTISSTHVGKPENLLLAFIHNNASLHCFIFLANVTDIIIFNILDSIMKFSGKKVYRESIAAKNLQIAQFFIEQADRLRLESASASENKSSAKIQSDPQ